MKESLKGMFIVATIFLAGLGSMRAYSKYVQCHDNLGNLFSQNQEALTQTDEGETSYTGPTGPSRIYDCSNGFQHCKYKECFNENSYPCTPYHIHYP